MVGIANCPGARLAVIVSSPRPRRMMLTDHGVLAPAAGMRDRVVVPPGTRLVMHGVVLVPGTPLVVGGNQVWFQL